MLMYGRMHRYCTVNLQGPQDQDLRVRVGLVDKVQFDLSDPCRLQFIKHQIPMALTGNVNGSTL